LEPQAALLRKCNRLQVSRSRTRLAGKAVAQPHVPMALLAQRHRDWACLLVLPPQTSNVSSEFGSPCQARFAALLLKCERLLVGGRRRGYPGKLFLSLILQRHCSHRGTETGAACLSCHLKLHKYLCRSVAGATGSPALKVRTSADSLQPERASLEGCCSASSAHGTARTEAQRLGQLPCLATSNVKRSFGGGSVVVTSGSPALKMRMSADSWQPERASL